MKRESVWILVVVIALMLGVAGCRQKPGYSDMDPNASKNQNRNSEAQAPVSTAEATPPATPASPSPATPRPSFQRPLFLGADGGNILDLPDYPRGRRQNVRIGPDQGANTMSMVLTTIDPMDKIAAFYEQTIKKNRWTVVARVVDPEFSEWSLKKGEENTARITLKKDTQSSLMTIVIVRSEKLEAPAK